MEEELSLDELREKVLEDLNSTPSIEEALERKKQEEALFKESFDSTFEVLGGTYTYRRNAISMLRMSKLRLHIARHLAILFNTGYDEYLGDCINKTNDLQKLIQKDDKLLDNLNQALTILYQNDVVICNYDICLVLACLCEKTDALVKEFEEYLETWTNRMNGFSYIGNKDYMQVVDEMDKVIEEKALKLGLNK